MSFAEIARTAGVKPAAVSNWRRRHPDTFPRPIAVGGRERFSQEEIAAWLDGRVIDRSSLAPGEAEGGTYGDRFRATLGAAERSRSAEEWSDYWAAQLRTPAFQRFRDSYEAILELVTTRLRDAPAWATIREAGNPETAINEFFRSKQQESALAALEVGGPRLSRELVAALDRLRRPTEDEGWAALTEGFLEALAEWSGPKAEHYTPRGIADLLLRVASPEKSDHVYDPSCGTGGLLVHAARAVEGEVQGDALWNRSARAARLGLKLRGRAGLIGGEASPKPEPESEPPRHFQIVLSNPPFSTRLGDKDRESRFGRIPARSPWLVWLCDAYERLAPNGRAAIIMPNLSLFADGTERGVRAAMIEAGAVDRIVTLPQGLFTHTGIGVTIWGLSRTPVPNILMVDGTDLGHMVDGSRRRLSEDDIVMLAATEQGDRSRRVSLEEIRAQKYDLTPSRYLARRETPSSGSLSDRLNALTDAEHTVAEADARAEEQLRRIISAWP